MILLGVEVRGARFLIELVRGTICGESQSRHDVSSLLPLDTIHVTSST